MSIKVLPLTSVNRVRKPTPKCLHYLVSIEALHRRSQGSLFHQAGGPPSIKFKVDFVNMEQT